MDMDKISKKLEKTLDKNRYRHTQGVMYTAASLAMRYTYDINEALLAGLLHDCGKFGTTKDQIKQCKEHHVELTESELEMPALIHARLGACLAREEYQIDNERILNAILYHTTGRPDMTTLEKIIYLADYIEPNRKMIPGLPEVRTLAFTDLDHAVSVCAKNTLDYLEQKGNPADPMTIKTYDYYAKGKEEGSNETECIQ